MTTINLTLQSEIFQMAGEIEELEKKRNYATNSKELTDLYTNLTNIGQRNLPRITQIINQYGWPKNDLIGEEGSRHFCAVIKGSCNIDLIRKALQVLRLAIDRKEANPALEKSLALIVERDIRIETSEEEATC